MKSRLHFSGLCIIIIVDIQSDYIIDGGVIMDISKIGNFIAEKRKQKNLTQQELADILHLSNRTISKWECGKGIPDSSIMMELCEVLDISVNELLFGENISSEEYKKKADENIISLIDKSQSTYKYKIAHVLYYLFSELILVIFLIICIYTNTMSGSELIDYIDMPALLIIVGTTIIILLITGLYKYFILSFKIGYIFCDDIKKEDIERSICSIKVVMLSAFLSGMSLSVASLMNTLLNTTTENIEAVGVAFSIGLIGIFYGILICILIIPLLGRMYKLKLQEMGDNNNEI